MSTGNRQMYRALRRRQKVEASGGHTEAKPVRHYKEVVRFSDRYDTALKSGPVKMWADMTPEEREKILESLKGRK